MIGEDPFDVERLWDKVYRGTIYHGRRGAAMQVLSGFDIACHDIMGKATDRPIHKLLGRSTARPSGGVCVDTFSLHDLRDAAGLRVLSLGGFTAVKFGWGPFGQDRKKDVALVAAAREAWT